MRPCLSIRPCAFAPHYLLHLLNRLHHIDTASLIRVLPWLYYPQALSGMVSHETAPLLISFFLNVVGLWNVIERLLTSGLIVRFHVVIKCFFVTQIPMKF